MAGHRPQGDGDARSRIRSLFERNPASPAGPGLIATDDIVDRVPIGGARREEDPRRSHPSFGLSEAPPPVSWPCAVRPIREEHLSNLGPYLPPETRHRSDRTRNQRDDHIGLPATRGGVPQKNKPPKLCGLSASRAESDEDRRYRWASEVRKRATVALDHAVESGVVRSHASRLDCWGSRT